MPRLLNTASVLMCPHGGSISVVTTNTRVNGASAPFVRATDTFTIVGCPFSLPSGPHPCVTVDWVQPAESSSALGDKMLTETSVGLCKAADQAVQGAVLVTVTQPRINGR